MHRISLAFVAALLAISAAPAAAHAAAHAPIVIGIVSDSANNPLPNVTVVVAEIGRSTTTNAEGRFVLRGLPAGEYHLSLTLLGYAPGHEVVRVPVAGDAINIEIKLTRSPLRMTSVVVSASPTGTESDRLTQSALELSGKALSRSLSSSLGTTLAAEPGISQRFSGPGASMPIIRGLTGDRILVLQDGERAGDLAAAAPDHGLSVDPLSAQRIEVVRGPSSLLYGNNALGGVVNVVSNDIPTVVPSHVEGSIGTQTESATPGGAMNAAISTAVGTRGAFSARAGFRSLGSQRTGGNITLDGTDSRASNASVGYGITGDLGTLGVAVKWYDFEYGLPAEAGDPEAGVRLDGQRIGVSARGGRIFEVGPFRYLKAEASAQDYSHAEIEPGGEVGTEFGLRTQTANLQLTTDLGRLHGAVGVQSLFKQYEAVGEEALTPAANSSGIGAFLFQELPLGDANDEHAPQLQLGARWDQFSVATKAGDPKFGPAQTTDLTNMSGSVGVSVPLSEIVDVSASLARSFRAPTVEELHSHGVHAAAGSYDRGNSSLESELSTGAEAILRLHGTRVSAQLAAYTNGVAGYITPQTLGDTVVDGDTLPLNAYTQADARLTGVEASVEMHLGTSIVASLMGDVVHGEFVDGGYLPYMPPARVGAGLRWESAGLFAGGEVRHGFAQDRVSGGADLATDAYTLVNLSAGKQWRVGNVMHQVTLRADNAFDERYFDAASRIKRFAANPGRNVTLLYQVQF
jgi:iron complex outermembrane receptor protein